MRTKTIGWMLGATFFVLLSGCNSDKERCSKTRANYSDAIKQSKYEPARASIVGIKFYCHVSETEASNMLGVVDGLQGLAKKQRDDQARATQLQAEANLAATQKEIASLWATFDALPKARKKTELHPTLEATLQKAATLPKEQADTAEGQTRASARERMAPLILPETRASGLRRQILNPSPKDPQCLVWGSMWSGDSETVSALLSLGFERIECNQKTWNLKASKEQPRGERAACKECNDDRVACLLAVQAGDFRKARSNLNIPRKPQNSFVGSRSWAASRNQAVRIHSATDESELSATNR